MSFKGCGFKGVSFKGCGFKGVEFAVSPERRE